MVLSALVKEYVDSAQPVGSKVLVDRYRLGCSPATVRNELAVLEETGYVFQPHVSAGRIPTDAGYRVFVDGMLAEGSSEGLSPAEIEAVRDFYLRLEHEVHEAVRETSAFLSRLTDHVAIVLAPTLRRARIRRINLVWLAPRRAVTVVVTDSGQVADRAVEFDHDVSEDDLRSVEQMLNGSLDGKYGEEVREARSGVEEFTAKRAGTTARIIDEVLDCLVEADADRVVHGGVSTLLSKPEFADPRVVQPLLRLLEDGLATLEVLTDLIDSGELAVRIGHENPEGLGGMSVVATHYEAAGCDGLVGVIGPTRMDYARAVSAVSHVADGLSEALG